MKIKKLQILNQAVFVGEQGKAESTTHDIEKVQDGYLCRHKRSGEVYFVPFALAVAQLDTAEMPAEDEETGEEESDARPAARRSSGRRARPKADTAPVQG